MAPWIAGTATATMVMSTECMIVGNITMQVMRKGLVSAGRRTEVPRALTRRRAAGLVFILYQAEGGTDEAPNFPVAFGVDFDPYAHACAQGG